MTFAGVVLVHGLLVSALWVFRIALPVKAPVAITVSLVAEPNRPQEPLSSPIEVRLTVPSVTPTVPVIPEIEAVPEPMRPAATEGAPVIQAVIRPANPEPLAAQLELQCPERRAPRYPAIARREREQGDVRMRVEIDELGRIESVSIIESSGSPRLDDAAREAIRSWRCQPAERDGRPVPAVALQTMSFVLEHR